jgi:hypothetical protein
MEKSVDSALAIGVAQLHGLHGCERAGVTRPGEREVGGANPSGIFESGMH